MPRRSSKKPEPQFATTEEMVAVTNVERQTLRQWVKRGLLPPAKIVSDGNGVKSRWPREALERLGGFRPDLVHANDWELWTRLAHDGPVAVVPGEHAAYRIHAGSDTNRLQRSMVYLTDPVAAARTITGRLVDPTERRDVARHVHRRLAEHALRVGADQAAAHEHRLAVTSAGWALRLSPDRRTAAAAAGIAATAVRNRLR